MGLYMLNILPLDYASNTLIFFINFRRRVVVAAFCLVLRVILGPIVVSGSSATTEKVASKYPQKHPSVTNFEVKCASKTANVYSQS